MRRKVAVLALNMGGPQTLKDVKPFLYRLFSDRDLIELPLADNTYLKQMMSWRGTTLQQQFADLIVKRRLNKVTDQYAQIGGGSPIRQWTDKQLQMMCKQLNTDNSDNEFVPYVAFRYADPLTEDAVRQMQQDNIKRVVVFSQYPQYSCSTTGSSLNELARVMSLLKGQFDVSFIDRWSTNTGLVQAFAHLIKQKLQSMPSDTMVLFSAHSLPLSIVERGDTYPQEVSSTVQAVMNQLNFSHPYRLSWQSQVGPSRWLGPQTAKAVDNLSLQGRKNVLLVPIAFTSDHIETLYELDVELKEEHPTMNLQRCSSLNDEPLFIKAMAGLVQEHMKGTAKHSEQLRYPCPGCYKDSCASMRSFFKL